MAHRRLVSQQFKTEGGRWKAPHVKRASATRRKIRARGFHLVRAHQAKNPRYSVHRIKRRLRKERVYRQYKQRRKAERGSRIAPGKAKTHKFFNEMD